MEAAPRRVGAGLVALVGGSATSIALPAGFSAARLAPAPDGSVLVSSTSDTRRLVPDKGSFALDPSYDVPVGARSIAFDASGAAMLVGNAALTRVAPDGTWASSPLDPRSGTPDAIVSVSQGEAFVVVGHVLVGADLVAVLTSYDAVGHLLGGFGTYGVTTTERAATDFAPLGAAVDAQGRLWVLLGGSAPGTLARYRTAP